MSGLDLSPSLPASDLNVMQNAAADLPAEFSEAFDVSWRNMTEWHNSAGYTVAKERAFQEYRDDVEKRTGQALPTLGEIGGWQGLPGKVSGLEKFNAAQQAIADQRPDANLTPLTEDRLHTLTLDRMAKAHNDSSAFARRETTWGGTAGTVAATLLGGLADPVTLATLPLGGYGEAGVVLRGLEFAAIGGGTEAATAALGYRTREAAVPGSSSEIPGEIASATLFGGALGVAFGTLGRMLGHGAKPLPTSVRDEVNVATSEAQLHATNPFPTAAGEQAARDAQVSAIEQVLRDAPVTVGNDFDRTHVAALADDLKAKSGREMSPDELAAAAEARIRPETVDLKPEPERFDPIPAAAEDTASYWERRLAAATPEERAALGATDDPALAGTTPLQSPSGTNIGIGTRSMQVWREMQRADDEAGTTFTTARGSSYEVHEDGTTTRNKAARSDPGHEGQQGPQPRSQATFYVDESGLNALAEFQTKGGGARSVEQLADGRWGVKYLDGKDAGKFERRTVIEVQNKPAVGLTPVEVWKDGRTVHFGNEITEVRGAPRFPVRDLSPADIAKFDTDPEVHAATQHDLDHIAAVNPDAEFTMATLQGDGSYRLDSRKLSDVLAEIDANEAAGRELLACATGLLAAAE